MFSLPVPILFTRSLNFRPGGRGPSVPIPLRGGGAGNLSQRIKGPPAEEVQACSYPCLPDEQERPPPAGQPAASGRSQVANILLLRGGSIQFHPVEVGKSVESE